MANTIRILFSFLGFMLIAGCKKSWLDVKQNKNQAVPTTLDDFQALLDPSVKMNSYVWGWGEVACDGHYVTDASWNSADATTKNIYTWSHSSPYTDIGLWGAVFNRIFYDNVVLDGLKKYEAVSSTEQQQKNDIQGQALLNRAVVFWSLAQHFAPAYNNSTSSTDLGLPLRLTSDITVPSVRSSIEATYNQILGDLKLASALLSPTSAFPTRGNKAAAYGYVARTYLSMSNYDSAFFYANKSLQLSNSLIDYNTLSQTASFVGVFNKEVIFHDEIYTSLVSSFLTTRYLVDSLFYNLYSDNDLRKSIFFKKSGTTITFKGNYNNNTTGLFGGIATDEVYLIRAECYARKGDISSAMQDLNTLMVKRWKNSVPFPTFTATTADEALSKILIERRKELVLRGLRWSDLRRLNTDDRFKVTITRTIGGNTYTLVPNSYQYTFPIPDDIISQTGMSQNKGW